MAATNSRDGSPNPPGQPAKSVTHPARLILNKGVRHRILTGHPWVFASEVDRIEGGAEDGGTIDLRSIKGEFLGSAIYNSRSQIVARRTHGRRCRSTPPSSAHDWMTPSLSAARSRPARPGVWSGRNPISFPA